MELKPYSFSAFGGFLLLGLLACPLVPLRAQSGVGIGVPLPQKRLHVDANNDFLRIDNLSQVSNTNNYLVIDGSGNVGKTTVENVAGQVIRLGFNGNTYNAGSEGALRFSLHNSAADMSNAPNGAANFINTISNAVVGENTNLGAGSGTSARQTDQLTLPAGVYRVTLRLCGNFGAGDGGNSAFVKFIVNNNEYSFVYTLTNPNSNVTHVEVSDYINLTGASSTLDFTFSPFVNNFTVAARGAAGSGQSYRSLLLVERLR
jgi:hypothetical protein